MHYGNKGSGVYLLPVFVAVFSHNSTNQVITMKKSVLLCFCAGMLVFGACSKTEKKDSDTATVTENTSTSTAENSADYDTRYRTRAGEVTTQMSQDLKLNADTATQSKLRNVYYTRAKRRYEARGKYANDTTGMYAEMKQIDLEADEQFRSILKPEQYQTFEAKRTTYYGGFEETDMPSSGYTDTVGSGTGSTSAEAGTSGTKMSPNAKVKTKTEKDGDTKTEIEDGKTETKIKTDADGHTKVKTNTKK